MSAVQTELSLEELRDLFRRRVAAAWRRYTDWTDGRFGEEYFRAKMKAEHDLDEDFIKIKMDFEGLLEQCPELANQLI